MVFQSAHYKRQENDDDLEGSSMAANAANTAANALRDLPPQPLQPIPPQVSIIQCILFDPMVIALE